MGDGKIELEVLRLMEEGRPFVLATVVRGSGAVDTGSKAIFDSSGPIGGSLNGGALEEAVLSRVEKALSSGPELIETAGVAIFLDPHLPAAKLLICGAGHIAVPLARFGVELGYGVTVIDDREDFASSARFPGCSTKVGDFPEMLGAFEFDRSTYAVVITRGHTHDVDCLFEILPRTTAYVGLIGSRRRTGFVKKDLAARGIPAEKLSGLFTPVGLAIGADTPAEIALSIMAEITMVRRKGVPETRKARMEEALS